MERLINQNTNVNDNDENIIYIKINDKQFEISYCEVQINMIY